MFSNCNHHHNKRISHYCQGHDQVVCTKCISDKHGKCKNVQPVEKAADVEKFGQTLNSLENRINHLKQVLTDILRTNEDKFQNLNDQKQAIRRQIKQIKSTILTQLEKVENELNKDLADKYKICAAQIEKDRLKFQNQKETLESWTREIKVMKDHASNVHLFSMTKVLSHQQKANEDLVQKHLSESKISNIDFEPARNLLDSRNLIQSYGKISIKEASTYLIHEHRKRGLLALNANNSGSPLLCKFDSTVFGNNVEIARGCFLPDDRLMIPDASNKTIYVCKMSGLNVQKIKLRFTPKDVCLLDKTRALVSCGDNGIVTIDLRTLSLAQSLQPGGCCSAVASTKDKIFVVNDECKISIVDLKGNVLKEISTRYDPYMITTDQNGTIYWTNYNNNYVNSILPSGSSQNVYTGSDLRESTGVAADSRGNVYVSGCESSNILRISRTDKSSKTLYAKRDGVFSPLGLSLSLDKSKLMVINNQRQVKIFKTFSS